MIIHNGELQHTYIRYPWWGYVKGILKQYGWALANLPHVLTDSQMEAVCRAIDETMLLQSGEQILRVVDLVLIKRTHTIAGAALTIPVSEYTAKRWHGNFIRAVAREMRQRYGAAARYYPQAPKICDIIK